LAENAAAAQVQDERGEYRRVRLLKDGEDQLGRGRDNSNKRVHVQHAQFGQGK